VIVLRALAPLSIDLAAVAGAAERDPEAYQALWRAVDTLADPLRLTDGIAAISFDHARRRDPASRYASIATDSLEFTPQLVTIELDPETFPLGSLSDPISGVDEVVLRIFPNQLGMLEVSMAIEDPGAGARALEEWTATLEGESVALTERLVRQIGADVLAPLLEMLEQADPKHTQVLRQRDSEEQAFEALWVARSLLVPEDQRELLAVWTKDTIDSELSNLRDDLIEGRRDSLVLWLNYGFVDVAGEGADAFRTGAHSAEYTGLRHAQEVYASLDTIDSQLQRVLADSAAADRKWQLEQLRGDLVWLSQRAELIIMGRQQLLKYMTRTVRAHFERILETWRYDRLVEESARFKIELCNRRLDELSSKRAARSSLVTDLILLGIGITSIAGTALAITEFGRMTASDPMSTGFDLGASRFTEWFASQPIDVVLLASGAVSAVLVVLYLYFRSDDGAS